MSVDLFGGKGILLLAQAMVTWETLEVIEILIRDYKY